MDEGDVEEELPPRGRRQLPRSQRLRLDLGLGVLGLVVAALIGNALAHHGGKPSSTSSNGPRTGSPAPAATNAVNVTRGAHGALPAPAPRARCPSKTECITYFGVPAPVRAAVAAAFPGARITSGRTVRLYVKNYGQALTSLDVNARRGPEKITLRLRGVAWTDVGRDNQARAGTTVFDGRRTVQYEAPNAQYDVLVEVVTPASRHVAVAPLMRLARDDRLLARY